eukprot:TRINITY_DN3030_c1_g1_i1.p1 TRINITY_DN3030_c1_g1~~TRINITY_DN3030_c1_g1_i1.p1  ORF type:complete len:369 (+),score=90.08 TRINITY_DN3030_c1_g1_i1:33-1109(+)
MDDQGNLVTKLICETFHQSDKINSLKSLLYSKVLTEEEKGEWTKDLLEMLMWMKNEYYKDNNTDEEEAEDDGDDDHGDHLIGEHRHHRRPEYNQSIINLLMIINNLLVSSKSSRKALKELVLEEEGSSFSSSTSSSSSTTTWSLSPVIGGLDLIISITQDFPYYGLMNLLSLSVDVECAAILYQKAELMSLSPVIGGLDLIISITQDFPYYGLMNLLSLSVDVECAAILYQKAELMSFIMQSITSPSSSSSPSRDELISDVSISLLGNLSCIEESKKVIVESGIVPLLCHLLIKKVDSYEALTHGLHHHRRRRSHRHLHRNRCSLYSCVDSLIFALYNLSTESSSAGGSSSSSSSSSL